MCFLHTEHRIGNDCNFFLLVWFSTIHRTLYVYLGEGYIFYIYMCRMLDDPAFLGRLLGLSAEEELISSIVCLFGLDPLLAGNFLTRFLVGVGE